MKILGIEAKAFLMGYLFSVVAFLLVFGVVWAVIYEHRLLSARLTATFFVNFFYSMIFYFLLTTAFSIPVYHAPTARRSIKIFIWTYGISVITLYVGLMLHSVYWGNPLRFILFQGDPISQFFYMLFLGVLSLVSAISAVLLYGIYRLTAESVKRRNRSNALTKQTVYD